MPKLVIWPFFSQQNKLNGFFRLDQCSGHKQNLFLMEQLSMLGWNVELVLPFEELCDQHDVTNFHGFVRRVYVPNDNLTQRLHWNTHEVKRILHNADVAYIKHETLPIVARCMFPNLPIATECGFPLGMAWSQTDFLIQEARLVSDLVCCNSTELARDNANATVWKLGFDERRFPQGWTMVRDIDVLFPQRASVTNYSMHKEFINAMRCTNLRIAMTDVTKFLAKTNEAPASWLWDVPNDKDYLSLLYRSKVVVGLVKNGYGGYAFREAVMAGCCPVMLRAKCYVDDFGEDWPYYFTGEHDMLEAITNALRDPIPVVDKVKQYSYQSAWPKVLEDLNDLCARRR